MNRPAARALLDYGRDLDVAKLTQALIGVDNEIERLRAALKPFADFADRKEYTLDDIDHGWFINAKLAMRGLSTVEQSPAPREPKDDHYSSDGDRLDGPLPGFFPRKQT